MTDCETVCGNKTGHIRISVLEFSSQARHIHARARLRDDMKLYRRLA